jgi:hypothetical protein
MFAACRPFFLPAHPWALSLLVVHNRLPCLFWPGQIRLILPAGFLAVNKLHIGINEFPIFSKILHGLFAARGKECRKIVKKALAPAACRFSS